MTLNSFERTGRCLLLGLAHILVMLLGTMLDDVQRPTAGPFAAAMFSLAAVALVTVALTLTLRGAVNWITACPLTAMYVAALTAVMWCSNTGNFGFAIAGDIGIVFCVLVYYSALPAIGYRRMSAEEEASYDPRQTAVY